MKYFLLYICVLFVIADVDDLCNHKCPATTDSSTCHLFGDTKYYYPEMLGGGWELVRRVKPGKDWHPSTDNLAGTDEYGTFVDDPEFDDTFTRKWDHLQWSEMLFATGDKSMWLIATKKDLLGSFYNGDVIKPYHMASGQVDGWTAYWFHREKHPEDPIVGLHDVKTKPESIVFMANGQEDTEKTLADHNGANVFIRLLDCQPVLEYGDTPGYCIISQHKNTAVKRTPLGSHQRMESCAEAARTENTPMFEYASSNGACRGIPDCPYFNGCVLDPCLETDKAFRVYTFPDEYKLSGKLIGGFDLSDTILVLQVFDYPLDIQKEALTEGFMWPMHFNKNIKYNVTIKEQPEGYTCYLKNPNGVFKKNVEDFSVECFINSYSVSGYVKGVLTNELTLGEDKKRLIRAKPSHYEFPEMINYKTAYDIIVETQATGYTCESDNKGITPAHNVTGLNVTCVINEYDLSGTVNKDDNVAFGTPLLLKKGEDTKKMEDKGDFTFPNKYDYNTSYKVKIDEQPEGYTCAMKFFESRMPASDVTNVECDCLIDSYNVYGTLGGDFGRAHNPGSPCTLSLTNNMDTLDLTEVGEFMFPTKIKYQYDWETSIIQDPEGYTCKLKNEAGKIPDADIKVLEVTCEILTYTVGGDLTGQLANEGVLVLSHGDETEELRQPRPFTFKDEVDYNDPYKVAIKTQPVGYTCTISDNEGKIGADHYYGVKAECTINSYDLKVMAKGVFGDPTKHTLSLMNKETSEVHKITALGLTKFSTQVDFASPYDVEITEHPVGYTCSLGDNNEGKMPAEEVVVVADCEINKYTVAGEIKGNLAATMYLRMGDERLKKDSTVTFEFKTKVDYNDPYEVVIDTQPTGYTCSINTNQGTMGAADVNDVAVACKINTYNLGGKVTGVLDKELVLQSNLQEVVVKSASEAGVEFKFKDKLDFKTQFDVTVKEQVRGFYCEVHGGKGTVGAGDVTHVNVHCIYTYKLAGHLTGDFAGTLELTNGASSITVLSTPWEFDDWYNEDTSYKLSVSKQPVGHTCEIAKPEGKFKQHTDITVSCAKNKYVLGGEIQGKLTTPMKLANGNVVWEVSKPGSLSCPEKVTFGDSYNVVIQVQPEGYYCNLVLGEGTMGPKDVTDVTIKCDPFKFGLSGSVSGEFGPTDNKQEHYATVTNGQQTITVEKLGSFRWAYPLEFHSNYKVEVQKQPKGYTCTVSNGEGKMPSNDVDNVQLKCAINKYDVAGHVEIFPDGKITLQEKKTTGEKLKVSSGNFKFNTGVPYKKEYDVQAVHTDTPDTICKTTGGSGRIYTNGISNINVVCSRYYKLGDGICADTRGQEPSRCERHHQVEFPDCRNLCHDLGRDCNAYTWHHHRHCYLYMRKGKKNCPSHYSYKHLGGNDAIGPFNVNNAGGWQCWRKYQKDEKYFLTADSNAAVIPCPAGMATVIDNGKCEEAAKLIGSNGNWLGGTSAAHLPKGCVFDGTDFKNNFGTPSSPHHRRGVCEHHSSSAVAAEASEYTAVAESESVSIPEVHTVNLFVLTFKVFFLPSLALWFCWRRCSSSGDSLDASYFDREEPLVTHDSLHVSETDEQSSLIQDSDWS